MANPTGNELIQVQGISATGYPSPVTEQFTLQQVANLANTEDSSLVETAITTVGNGTLTAAALVGGQIARSGPVANYTDTTDTAANILLALPGFVSGVTFLIRIKNATAFTQTLSAGSGVTLPATNIIPAFSFGWYFSTQAGTAAAPTYTWTHMGTVAIADNVTVPASATVALNTVGAGTILAASMVAGYTTRGGAQSGTAFTDTTDTAANIAGAQPGLLSKYGTSFIWKYINATNATATIVGGTNVTISGQAVIPQNMSVTYIVTNASSSSVTLTAVAVDFVSSPITLTDTINTDAQVVAAQSNFVSSTTFANLSGIAIPLTSGGTYALQGVFPCTSGASGGLKLALNSSNSLAFSALNLTAKFFNATTLDGVANTTTTTLQTALGTTSAVTYAELSGVAVVSAAGTLNVQAAQNASNATTTSVFANGYMEVTRMS